MKAIIVKGYGGAENLELIEKPKPEPSADEVRLAVYNAGVNFADIEKRKGAYPNAPEPPYTPGIEVAGVIDAVGRDVDREPGDTVAAIVEEGGYAEYVTLDPDNILEIPEGVDIADASAFPVNFLTAYNAFHEWGRVEEDESVLVHAAAGGVGSAAVQLAALIDVEVYATASTERKLNFVAELGADTCLNYETTDVGPTILKSTSDEGVDLILDGVGGDAFYTSLELLADSGRIVTYGIASGNVPVVSPPRLIFENQSLIGFHLGHALDHERSRLMKSLPPLHEGFDEADLQIYIGKRFDLEDAGKAHDFIENRKSIGKVILDV
ncbi:NADPH:quinone reductase [Halobacteriales archaeon QS_1_69_70]|nr:MAG: NADPH:quinone reductase [Halobacteriales archaeon QS_1_69_70]